MTEMILIYVSWDATIMKQMYLRFGIGRGGSVSQQGIERYKYQFLVSL
jgi:hypothetical protein